MALMAPIISGATYLEDPEELFDRCLRAAEAYWLVDDFDVFMPVVDSPDAIELRRILQSIGLTVLTGSNGADFCELSYQQAKIIIFHESDWRNTAARNAAIALQASFPRAIICVVAGLLPVPHAAIFQRQPAFEDARALLQTAGIGFFSIEKGLT
jgi:hypothetical protein